MSLNRILITFSTLLLGASACEAPATPTPKPAPPTDRAAVAPAPLARKALPVPVAPVGPPPVGMVDPFGRLDAAAVKAVDDGWKALRARRYPEAREAFHLVVARYPDKPAARFQELRAAVLAGDFVAAPALWRELLARDFVGYADRLDRGKETAALRATPEWKQMQVIKAESRRAYRAGLDKGTMFVARTHLGGEAVFSPETGEAKVELNQEAYHYDPVSERIRRLSDTGGQVVAIHPDTDYRQLIVLTTRAVKKVTGATAFSQAGVVVVSLDTLEPVGPFALAGEVVSVDICFSPKGEPIWSVTHPGVEEASALTLDATFTGLVPLDEGCPDTVAVTSVDAIGIEHFRPDPEGVALSEDGLQLSGVDGERPLRVREVIRAGSFSWSPGRARFVYTGSVDQCAPGTNSLYVWDAGRKRAARVAAAVASYETQWLDDDHLVYESAMGRAPRLTIHDFAKGDATSLKTPAGAGLFGLPTVPCPGPGLASAYPVGWGGLPGGE